MLNITELQTKLEELPTDIYNQEKIVLVAKEKVELSKIDFDVSYSTALLATDAPNATEKKAQALVGSSEIKKDLVKNEMEFLKQNAYLTALNNKFIALRKISSIEERLMQSKISGN